MAGSESKKAQEDVADSWEDEDVSSSDEQPAQRQSAPVNTATASSSSEPYQPPPPASTSQQQWTPSGATAAQNLPEKRPEKTDAVARRMIAAGLGLKAPKQTEEQKEYQRSIREQEKKRREQERAQEQKRKEDAKKAKAAMWDD